MILAQKIIEYKGAKELKHLLALAPDTAFRLPNLAFRAVSLRVTATQ